MGGMGLYNFGVGSVGLHFGVGGVGQKNVMPLSFLLFNHTL